MRILIDLGTSRTGVAFLGSNQEWRDPGDPVRATYRAGANSWGVFDKFITGCLNLRYEKAPRPHLVTFSRYAQVGSLVLPFSDATQDLPPGAEAIPDIDKPFTSLKEKEHRDYGAAFLTALSRIVSAYDEGGAQWVVGRSAGGIDPRRIGGLPASTVSYNEAVAVVFALASLNIGKLSTDYADKFLLLADLGGGFLDISLADHLEFAEDSGNATIVNYGGYPLGVDRVAQRFSTTPVPGPDKLIEFISLAIRYHLWDYFQRSTAATEGIIVLAGGGFERFDRVAAEQRIKKEVQKELQGTKRTVAIHVADCDTKFMTLAGLGRMAQLGVDEGGGGDDISRRNPLYHGKHLIAKPSGDDTWYALLENLRNSYY